MEKHTYRPEGLLIDTPENRAAVATITGLMQAREEGRILEGKVIRCDVEHNLIVQLPCGEGIIPHDEGAMGITDGSTKEIALLTRVNKPVCFVVTDFEQTPAGPRPVLSRRLAQERCKAEYLDHLQPGDVIPARITRLETFGVFCDVGCGRFALLPITDISVSRIAHPRARFVEGWDILGVVSSVENDRICLSHRELLGTWEENAACFNVGEIVVGTVRSVESYGIFVELAPNLAGLAEGRPDVAVGQQASVYIKSILPEKMKVKLALIDTQNAVDLPRPPEYFITQGPIYHWRYSPEGSPRVIERTFRVPEGVEV